MHKITTTREVIKSKDLEGRSTVNQYVLLKMLGEGTHGKVKLGMRGEDGVKFAIKVINKNLLKRKKEFVRDSFGKAKLKDPFEGIRKEIAIMKKLSHPHLIRLHEVIDHEESHKLYLVLDFAERGQYLEWNHEEEVFYRTDGSEAFTEEDRLREIFIDCIHGLEYLHYNDIVHRDIKPQNILVDDKGKFKIADFGVSSLVCEQGLVDDTQGTYHFMAPEECSIEGIPTYSGKIADIWSLGVTFYSFVFHEVPFNHSNHQELFKSIETQSLMIPELKRSTSAELKDLLTKMLEKDPAKRITLEDMKKHSWIVKDSKIDELTQKMEKVEVTTREIQNALVPICTVVFVQRLLRRVRSRKENEQKIQRAASERKPIRRLSKGHTGEFPPETIPGENTKKKLKRCTTLT